mmetsp:Transcript_35037/g.76496  ORF Transcript_35037/g.76496 Transcript_35037/m.76496 type:complete len:156 (-) Transcript_35037:508-975(-)
MGCCRQIRQRLSMTGSATAPGNETVVLPDTMDRLGLYAFAPGRASDVLSECIDGCGLDALGPGCECAVLFDSIDALRLEAIDPLELGTREEVPCAPSCSLGIAAERNAEERVLLSESSLVRLEICMDGVITISSFLFASLSFSIREAAFMQWDLP